MAKKKELKVVEFDSVDFVDEFVLKSEEIALAQTKLGILYEQVETFFLRYMFEKGIAIGERPDNFVASTEKSIVECILKIRAGNSPLPENVTNVLDDMNLDYNKPQDIYTYEIDKTFIELMEKNKDIYSRFMKTVGETEIGKELESLGMKDFIKPVTKKSKATVNEQTIKDFYKWAKDVGFENAKNLNKSILNLNLTPRKK